MADIGRYILRSTYSLFAELTASIRSFDPPVQQGIRFLFYRLFSEKLYEIRFAYIYWNAKF
jgi:hypothetical protein